MNVNAKLVEKTSKKGNQYKCIEIQISPNYKKIVFLTVPEIALLEQNIK